VCDAEMAGFSQSVSVFVHLHQAWSLNSKIVSTLWYAVVV